MSEEAAGKLRLKPRKAAAGNREPSPGREPARRTLAGGCSWFEKDDWNECDKPWMLVLKGIGQGFWRRRWQTVPSFPELPGKSAEEQDPRKQEVFTVGTKDFQWVSFPSFRTERLQAEDPSSHRLTRSQTDRSRAGRGHADELQSVPSPAEETRCVPVADTAKNVAGEDTEGGSGLDASPESRQVAQHGSAHPLASPQSSARAFGFQQGCRGPAQGRRGSTEEKGWEELRIQTHQGSISSGEGRHVPAGEKPPLESVSGTESCKTEDPSEGSSTLASCPMCLTRFSGTLSQLDIDGHLARCLSESADDITW
ncbi:Fanconi anemia core complex-associated protein 20 [Rhynochetos jubatus]